MKQCTECETKTKLKPTIYGGFLCETCADDHHGICSRCNKYAQDDDMYPIDVQNANNWTSLCCQCLEELDIIILSDLYPKLDVFSPHRIQKTQEILNKIKEMEDE